MTERDSEVPITVTSQPPLISNYGLVLTVYILYLFGFLTAITALVGAIIAYLQQNTTDPVCQSHFRFQINDLLDRAGLSRRWVPNDTYRNWRVHFALVDHLELIRCVKGLLALNTGEPIRNPNSWWFGDR